MSKKKNDVIAYIKALENEKKTISYGGDQYVLQVNEDVSMNDIYVAINSIVNNVVDNEFDYELIDIMLPYYYIDLFTDIEVPKTKDENGDERDDYIECYKIATWLNLEYELTEVSPIVAGYIYMMAQNIWRRLEYHKSQGAFVQRELMDAISAFYEIMDELEQVVDVNKDIDIETFASQLADISSALNEISQKDGSTKTSLDLIRG